MTYEQQEMDLRLDWERDLDDNVETVITFVYKILMDKNGDNTVKNRREGYGLLAEQYVGVTTALKDLKDDMGDFLKVLGIDDFKAVDAVSSIDRSLHKLIVTTVRMAAQAKRISDELYQIASEYKTPLEEYMDGENTDGFEKVETITPAESEE